MKISMSFLYGLVEAISRLKECSFGATAEIILHLQIGKVTSQITLNQWKTVYKWLHSPENGMIGLVVTTPILYVKRVFSKKQIMSLKDYICIQFRLFRFETTIYDGKDKKLLNQ